MKKEKYNLLKYAIGSFITALIICLIAVFFLNKTSATKLESVSAELVCTPIVRVVSTPTPAPEFEKIRCKVTAYCTENYPHICNDGDASTTSTGRKPIPGVTVAVDPDVIPYFSNVIINGNTYIANDTGGSIKGNRVDIVFATHQEALEFGIQYADVYYVAP